MKRFYKNAVASACEGGGYNILLDAKPVLTPGRQALIIEGPQSLADAIASEWLAQEEKIQPEFMPVTQIMISAQERVPVFRADIQVQILAYIHTDLICYRAETPHHIATRQSELWDPFLDWFRRVYHNDLQVTTGLGALRQDARAVAAVQAQMDSLSHLEFTLLQLVVSLTGSLVLALAFLDGFADETVLMRAAWVEEDLRAEIYDADKYGHDPHEEKQRAAMARDLAAARFIRDQIRTAQDKS